MAFKFFESKHVHMVSEVFRSLNNKADHLVNWDLAFSIHEDMDANQALFQSHLVSALRFQLKNKI
jgi:hypothetical protein